MDPVEMVRESYERFNARQRDELLEFAHPEFEVESPMASLRGAPYRGPQGMRAWLADLDAAWERFRLRPETFELTRNGVLVTGSVDLLAKGSGLEMTVASAWLWKLEDGLVRRLDVFTDRSEAERAARGG